MTEAKPKTWKPAKIAIGIGLAFPSIFLVFFVFIFIAGCDGDGFTNSIECTRVPSDLGALYLVFPFYVSGAISIVLSPLLIVSALIANDIVRRRRCKIASCDDKTQLDQP